MAQQMAFAATSRDIRRRVRPKTVSEYGIARKTGNILMSVAGSSNIDKIGGTTKISADFQVDILVQPVIARMSAGLTKQQQLLMWPSVCQAAYDAYRTIIPCPQDRIPIRPHHVPRLLLPLIPFLAMAYLSRRPDTFYLRLLLLPLVICLIFGTYFRFMYADPELNIYNWGQGIFAELICGKAIDFAWRREGMLKADETKPGVLAKLSSVSHCSNGSSDGGASSCKEISSYTAPPRNTSLPPWLHDSFEVVFTMRGLGWQFGTDLYIPRDPRPSERSAFLWATATSTFKHFLIFDTLESLIKLVPEVGSPHGGTIFKHNLPISQRYILSTAIHLATGTCLISGFEMVHGCITLFALIALSSSPEMWPPLMDNPWICDSLHVFWAKRWHQVFRQTFLVYGGFLGKLLAGDIGMLFGTFFASGMYHECAAYMLGKGFHWPVVLFFMSQALLLLLEKLWRRTTGKRLAGIYGRLWVYSCIFVMAQPLVDSWYSRGLGGGLMIPPGISPARRLFIPLLRRAEEAVGFGPLSAMQMFLDGEI
ncbi:hypothetical protein OG21DRAFT_1507333 [Imleria badia]|nr:hypothetical protein OG21DRAFT_1507333 [Imleria badia]